MRAAREAITGALEFTLVDEPAWRVEREILLVLEADTFLRDEDPVQALAALDRAQGLTTRLGLLRRSDVLDQLDRKNDADQERYRASVQPPRVAVESLFLGIDHVQRRDFAAAIRDFDQVLMLEPEQFLARFLQAFCFLQLKRPDEAKVALTACIGCRPALKPGAVSCEARPMCNWQTSSLRPRICKLPPN